MNFSVRKMLTFGLTWWVIFAAATLYFVLPLRNKLRFGIDLVGGSYITLEVQTNKAIEAALEDKMEGFTRKLKDAGKSTPKSYVVEKQEISMTYNDVASAQAALNVLRGEKGMVIGGTENQIKIRFDERMETHIARDAVQRNVEVLRTRLDKLSVAEIAIATKGDKQITVELPDVPDPQQAQALIGTPAILEFKLVEKEGRSPEEILYEYDGVLPSGMEIVPGKSGDENNGKKYYLVLKRSNITGKDLKDARPFFDQDEARMAVSFTLTPEGGDKFALLTGRNYGRILAVVLDGVIITAATIQTEIRANGKITGGFSSDEAKELSVLLKSGSFVAPVTFEEVRQMQPSLGAEAVRDGIISCAVGLGLLFLFCIYFYSLSGLFAFITLIYNLLLVVLCMVWMKATLTMPGIAGLVLTVGMAVDASVIIYEEIRDELALGMTIKKAVDTGFSGALRVILDSNITTFITGLVLYKFGTGPVQGFAITMMFGIAATLVTGLFFLKSIFNFVLANFDIQKLRI
jgi:preprotein translocase subunit SecD